MNFFDTANSTFRNPLNGELIHYKRASSQIRPGEVCMTIWFDKGNKEYTPLIGQILYKFLDIETKDEGDKMMKSKGISKVFRNTTSHLPDLAFLPRELEKAIEIIDDALTERYGKTETHVDKRHRLAGHVRLEFE